MKSLYEIINETSEAEVKKILSDAKKKANDLEKSIVDSFAQKQDERFEKSSVHHKTLVAQKKKESEFKLNQVKGNTQREVLDALFGDALKTLNSYSDDKLLDFAASMLKKSDAKGNEVIVVNKCDYPKFLKAFSSAAKGNLVDADKLNKKLSKTSYKLSNDPATIKDGFLLLGDKYDLSFEFASLIDKLQEEKEKEISEILFNERT